MQRRDMLIGLVATSLLGTQAAHADWRSDPALGRLNERDALARARQDQELANLMRAVSNVFEVGHPATDYAYVEDLHDGRGYTVTSYGFCTGTGEVSELITRYLEAQPDSRLGRYLQVLPPTHADQSAATDFAVAWRHEAGASPLLTSVCDELAQEIIFRPAMAAARAAEIVSPAGKLIIYDTVLQHGADADPDSLTAILAQAKTLSDPPDAGFSEVTLVRNILRARARVLHDPSFASTTAVWRASIPRIDALRDILECNPLLMPPVLVRNHEMIAYVWP